jgi:hypothetical protein
MMTRSCCSVLPWVCSLLKLHLLAALCWTSEMRHCFDAGTRAEEVARRRRTTSVLSSLAYFCGVHHSVLGSYELGLGCLAHDQTKKAPSCVEGSAAVKWSISSGSVSTVAVIGHRP